MEETAECMGKHGWVALGGVLRERECVGGFMGGLVRGWAWLDGSLGGQVSATATLLLTVFTARHRRRHHYCQAMCEIAVH